MKDIGNTCVECREDTSWGSGKFVNRVPATTDTEDGYICADCQAIECDECDTPTLEWDHPKHDDTLTWCVDCLDKHNAGDAA